MYVISSFLVHFKKEKFQVRTLETRHLNNFKYNIETFLRFSKPIRHLSWLGAYNSIAKVCWRKNTFTSAHPRSTQSWYDPGWQISSGRGKESWSPPKDRGHYWKRKAVLLHSLFTHPSSIFDRWTLKKKTNWGWILRSWEDTDTALLF